MKLLFVDKKNNFVKVLINSVNDFFHLEQFIEENDIVGSKSFRKFSSESGSERKEVFVQISVEEVFFRKELNQLRIFGKIVGGGPEEYIQLGKHHSLDVSIGETLEIRKEKLYDFQIYLLKEWEKETNKPNFAIVAIDEEKATIAVVFPYGIGKVKEVRSHLSKRLEEREFLKKEEEYLKKILKAIEEAKVKFVVVCGPGFEKEKLIPLIKHKVFSFHSTSSELSAIYEVMRSEEFQNLSKELMLKQEEYYVEKLLEEISKQGNYAIGLKNVSEFIFSRTAKVVLVTDKMLKKKEVKELIEEFKRFGGSLRIINEDSSSGKQLSSLGGIAALTTT
jgi:protein pelota